MKIHNFILHLKIYKDDISSYNKHYKGWHFHTYDKKKGNIYKKTNQCLSLD